MPKRPTKLAGTRRPWPEPRQLALAAESAGALPATEARLLVLTGEEHCTGPWRVPDRLAIKAIFGELVLDLREASFPNRSWLDIDAIMAQVRIILPPGVRVSFEVQDWFGDAKDARGDRLVQPDDPHLVVTGSAWFAEIQLRDR